MNQTNGRNWTISALFAVCMSLAGLVGYLVAARFTKVESRQEATESDIGVLKIRVEILEGGNVRLDMPIDKAKLQRMVMDEIRRQTQEESR